MTLPRVEDREEWIKRRPKLERFNGRKMIIHALLWTIHQVVLKRIKVVWKNNAYELKKNEDFWTNFSIIW
jgi:hypothetical protein